VPILEEEMKTASTAKATALNSCFFLFFLFFSLSPTIRSVFVYLEVFAQKQGDLKTNGRLRGQKKNKKCSKKS
jgi:hypothetical protein